MGTAQRVNVDVIVTSDSKSPNGVRFAMNSNLGSGNQLTFKNKKKGDWFEVDFTIVDDNEPKTGYLFPDDEKLAMYVKPVDDLTEPCPDDWNDPRHWDQFEAQQVTNKNQTLRVRNWNHDIQLFKFTLWVTKTPNENGPCIPYDPVGSNQNGGSGMLMTYALVGAAVVAGAAALYSCGVFGS